MSRSGFNFQPAGLPPALDPDSPNPAKMSSRIQAFSPYVQHLLGLSPVCVCVCSAREMVLTTRRSNLELLEHKNLKIKSLFRLGQMLIS